MKVITDQGLNRVGIGTGYAIDPGTVLTNAHVIEDGLSFSVVLPSGQRVPARVTRSDDIRDLALLTVSGAELPAVSFGPAEGLPAGQRLLALGYPQSSLLAGEPTLTSGIVSALREIEGVRYVQTDVPINPGNSGGPLFTLCGDVVGTVVASVRGTVGLNLAISLRDVQGFLAGTAPQPPSVRQPTPPPVTPRPATPRPATPSPAPIVRRDAVTTVRVFYALLAIRDYTSAYQLLSTNYQRREPFAQWRAGYATTESIGVDLIAPGPTPDVVLTSITATDNLPTGRIAQRFSGEWRLVLEGGEWRMDVGRLRPAP